VKRRTRGKKKKARETVNNVRLVEKQETQTRISGLEGVSFRGSGADEGVDGRESGQEKLANKFVAS
jgi:hypothetical protein